MGVMDKFLNYMKLNDGDDDEDYLDDDYLDDEEEEEVIPKKSVVKSKNIKEEPMMEDKTVRRSQPKVTPIKPSSVKRVQGSNGMEVCVIKPTSFEEAREVTETLLAGRAVVLNLEGIDVDIAQRIIDVTYGSCFAIGGNLQKISHYIFIITPASVEISGDFQDIFGTGGSFEMPLHNGL